MGREELKKLGPLSRNEKITAGALGLTVGLWIFGSQLGLNAVAAALLGLAILLITNVVRLRSICFLPPRRLRGRGALSAIPVHAHSLAAAQH